MRVRVDPALCSGYGECERICPEVFHVGEDDISYVLVPTVEEVFKSAVRKARDACPMSAIIITEDD